MVGVLCRPTTAQRIWGRRNEGIVAEVLPAVELAALECTRTVSVDSKETGRVSNKDAEHNDIKLLAY